MGRKQNESRLKKSQTGMRREGLAGTELFRNGEYDQRMAGEV